MFVRLSIFQRSLPIFDLSKQKELDSDARAIQQIEFYGKFEINAQVCTVLKKIKRNCIRILPRNS